MGRFGIFLLPLLLCGCLTTKGTLMPAENASTPLAAGAYYRIEPGDPLPELTGPFKLTVQGKVYTMHGGRDVLKFQLIRLVVGKNIYVAQAVPGSSTAADDNVAVLFGPLTPEGFCDYSDPANGYPGVDSAGTVVSNDVLRQWLIGHVDDIAKKTKGVCWVKLTHDSPAGKPP